MAHIKINFYGNSCNLLESVEIIGAKQSMAWKKNAYGSKSNELKNDYYFVKKPNKYGITWITQSYGMYGESYRDFSRYSNISLPSYNYKIFIY